MKLVTKVTKRIIFAFTVMYSFNILLTAFNLNIAVNPYSLAVVSTTGIPGMISLIIVKYIIK